MRVVVLSPNVPFPANRGGLADVWRRIQAISLLGHDVMLVAPIDSGLGAVSAEVDAVIDGVVKAKFYYSIRRGFWLTLLRLLRSFLVPWHASTRIPDANSFEKLIESVRAFRPEALWLDGPWLGVLGNCIASQLNVPILYRSHNIEFAYMRGQSKIAVKFRDRLALRLSCLGLETFEKKTMQQAAAVFDISVDDMKYWQANGIKNIFWLPPLPELSLNRQSSPNIEGDIVFIGNLGTPNNVRGVEWFVTEVLPLVRTRFPNVRCRIIGSNPTPFIMELLMKSMGVDATVNVPDPTPYLFGAKVLVNPVMSGSGVQVKMLDMLMTDASIVTATQGTRGLPPEFKGLFRIADDPNAFAQAVCEELVFPSVDIAARLAAREGFSVASVGRALEVVAQNKY
ncbi:glycosyltransferase family 4 protein [Dechloromonas sp. ZS-1]|uniref:glycosyltransferase n=1 Tax=Dechloromonas sp. ZS-1 TaxID=3138067 RepID=UPI0031FBDF0C